MKDPIKTLLNIRTSLFGAQGQSSRLAAQFIAEWSQRNPGGRVITRDLAAEPIPHLTAEEFQAFGTQVEARTPAQQAAVAYSDALIAELAGADTLVLAVPMYNFSVPSTLRAYFDHVARAGVTFHYTSAGPKGLLQGRHAYVFITRGGIYPEAADTQTPYLRQFLGFIGIEPHFIYAEGLAMGDATRERSIAAASSAIAELPRLEQAA